MYTYQFNLLNKYLIISVINKINSWLMKTFLANTFAVIFTLMIYGFLHLRQHTYASAVSFNFHFCSENQQNRTNRILEGYVQLFVHDQLSIGSLKLIYEFFYCNQIIICYWSWNYRCASTILYLQLILAHVFKVKSM